MLSNGIAVIQGDTHASKWIEEQGKLEHDPTIEKVLMPMLKEGDTALDIGAMLGAYSHGFKRAVGNGEVFAFEPNPEAFRCLKINCPSVRCYNFAIGAKRGRCSIKRHELYPDNHGATEVITDDDGTIPVQSLDDLLKDRTESIKLIKIDVEGMEPEVILGGMNTIRKFRPIIFVEINHIALRRHDHRWTQIVDPLIQLDYRVRFIGEGHNFTEQDWPQLDVLFIP